MTPRTKAGLHCMFIFVFCFSSVHVTSALAWEHEEWLIKMRLNTAISLSYCNIANKQLRKFRFSVPIFA
ncbi:unnamed protein product [Leptidea sinapis]|uniref:Secreted protein n=1 Tax=Leptidea sinapis TaxID=189913 RepID=A0A5E4R2D0_9NEOP|nr:unnamed protein product [Leptidea sinapis]